MTLINDDNKSVFIGENTVDIINSLSDSNTKYGVLKNFPFHWKEYQSGSQVD
jgi:hypothetical protein